MPIEFITELNLLENLILRTILATLTAFALCLLSGKWTINQLSLMQIRQHIRKEGPTSHYNKAGTPTMGGILIIFSTCTSAFIWANLKNPLLWTVFLSTISFGIIGFVDDYVMQIKNRNKGLGAKKKLILQTIAASIITCLIYTLPSYNNELTIPFFKNIIIDLEQIYLVFSVIIIVGTSNSVNLTDGLDGMAIGTTIIAKTVYMFLAVIAGFPAIAASIGIEYINGSTDLAIYCGSFVGSGLGFLWFNSYPAQIFMGDTGSLSIGASLGTIAILVNHEILLLLVGGIFVIETMSVILQFSFFKITKGQRLFRMTPIHHHFELKGWEEPKIVSRFWIIAIILGLLSFISLKL